MHTTQQAITCNFFNLQSGTKACNDCIVAALGYRHVKCTPPLASVVGDLAPLERLVGAFRFARVVVTPTMSSSSYCICSRDLIPRAECE